MDHLLNPIMSSLLHPEFFTPIFTSGISLESEQVSSGLNSAVVWTVSIVLQDSNTLSLFFRFLGIVPKFPAIIIISLFAYSPNPKWCFFTEVWVTSNHLRSPLFEPILTVLYSEWSSVHSVFFFPQTLVTVSSTPQLILPSPSCSLSFFFPRLWWPFQAHHNWYYRHLLVHSVFFFPDFGDRFKHTTIDITVTFLFTQFFFFPRLWWPFQALHNWYYRHLLVHSVFFFSQTLVTVSSTPQLILPSPSCSLSFFFFQTLVTVSSTPQLILPSPSCSLSFFFFPRLWWPFQALHNWYYRHLLVHSVFFFPDFGDRFKHSTIDITVTFLFTQFFFFFPRLWWPFQALHNWYYRHLLVHSVFFFFPQTLVTVSSTPQLILPSPSCSLSFFFFSQTLVTVSSTPQLILPSPSCSLSFFFPRLWWPFQAHHNWYYRHLLVHSVFSALWKHLSKFSFSFWLYNPLNQQNLQSLFFLLINTWSALLVRIWWSICIREFSASHFLGQILVCACIICQHGQILIS